MLGVTHLVGCGVRAMLRSSASACEESELVFVSLTDIALGLLPSILDLCLSVLERRDALLGPLRKIASPFRLG
jgi:hypothetical protein